MGRTPEYYRQRYARRRDAGTLSKRASHISDFVAIDGEALETGEYFLLAASTGDTLTNLEGISTVQAFEWLLNLKAENPHTIFVAFGLNYDVNQILRDVHKNKLATLWDANECEWLSPLGLFYRLEWIPGKRFAVRTGRTFNDSMRSVMISEVFGFFQMSFVNALMDWEIPDEDGALARIVSGKAERGTFRTDNLADVTRYCLSECRMLVTLMDKLRATFHAAGIRPQSWQGAGSAAGAVLKHHKVRDYHRTDESLPKALRDAVMRAYYGGRSEVFLQGFVGDCVGYDINSAYPAEAANLPSLHGEWKYARTYNPTAPYALWRVVWRTNHNAPVQPFPYRDRRTITYPYSGAGWYWQDEVRAACALHGDAIRIVGGWCFTPHTNDRPFDFVPHYYRLKAEAKAAGDATQRAYKLALNSLYGKLAQGTGYGGRVPWQRSYVWAGLITSGTRARLLECATHAPGDVVFMATDGIVFRRDPNLDYVGDGLGALDRSEYPSLFVAQSGIYCANDNGGREVFRSRGFFKHEVNFARIQAGWRTKGPNYRDVSTSRRYVGLGTALARTDPPRWEVWRTWHDAERVMFLYPNRKYIDPLVADDLETGSIAVPDVVRWVAPEGDTATLSAAYKPKTAGLPADADPDYVQGFEQPYPGDEA